MDPITRALEILPRILYSLPSVFLSRNGSLNELDIALLRILKQKGPLSVIDIHRTLAWEEVEYKRVSARLTTLQNKGLVKQNVVGRKREKEITITGNKALETIEAERIKYITPILDLLAPSQRESALAFLVNIPPLLTQFRKERET